MYDFDTLLLREKTNCTKWDALKRDFGREDLLPFWVADMDFPVLPEIVQAISRRVSQEQTFGYTFAGEEYLESILRWNKNRHALELDKEDIIPIPGVVTAISVILQRLTKEKDAIVINPPVYTPFFHAVEDLGRTLVQSPLVERDGRYTLDFDHLERVFQQGAKLYLLCSPHNPVGRVWDSEELERIVQLCRQYNVLLVSDEIHDDIVFSGHVHVPVLNVEPRAVQICAPSKTFNIAGLKSSVIFVKDPEIRRNIQYGVDMLHLYPNLFAYEATTAAYCHGARWLDELNRYLEENARFTVDYLGSHLSKVKTYVPESTYLMWLDFSALNLSDEELEQIMIQQARVALNKGSDYGPGYGQYMRLNIGVPRSYLEKGLKQIVEAFHKF